jgi:hypothetical protein
MPGLVVSLLLALALPVADPPAAPPEPPPIPSAAPGPETKPTDTTAPASPDTTGGQSSAPASSEPAKAPPPRRLWVILDYYKEFGGTVLREDEASISLRTPSGEERTVDRNSIVTAIPLLDDPEGTRVIVCWRGGRTLNGELVSDGFEEVVVRFDGVRTSLPRREILSVEREPPFEDQLARFRARIPPDAWDVRMELVRWLLAQGHPEIAVEELREIRKNADSDEAARLLVRAEAEVELQRKNQERIAAGGRVAPRPDAPELVKRLSDEDVNMIRVMEVDLRSPPRMRHALGLSAEILTRYPDDERLPPAGMERHAMSTWPTERLLKLLFTLKARDLYPMVQIDEDPEHLRLFRKRVHDGWLIPNCATSRCHGGPSGGRLVLATTESKSARTAYTNMLILLAFRTEQGMPLVDFDDAQRSLMMGFGRPRTEATVQHPAVAGWKPVTPSLQKAIEEDALAWIGGMHRPHNGYPVKVETPRNAAPAAAEDRQPR